jgi:UDP-glucose 4-epimerase
MQYALITGGLGFIGSHVARQLLADRIVDQVVLLDHYGSYVSPLRSEFIDYRRTRLKGIEGQVVIERGQAHYPGVLFQLLVKYRPRYIFHLAALPLASLQNLNSEEALEGSVLSTARFLEICSVLQQSQGYQLERFVYASSSMVYGDFQYTPADERHPTNPKEIYGTMKLAGEICTRGLAGFYGIPSTIIRPSAVYGPTDMNRRVSQVFIEKALLGQKLTVQGVDEALDFTYVTDTARGFVLAAVRPEGVGQTFNITSGHAYTLLEYVQILQELIPDLQYEVVERDTIRPKRGTLAIDKAQRMLGYCAEYDLRRGISEYVAFRRKFPI